MIDRAIKVLTYFKVSDNSNKEPMEELIYNWEYKNAHANKKFDAFPFNKIGTVILNILYKIVKRNDKFLNEILVESNFG